MYLPLLLGDLPSSNVLVAGMTYSESKKNNIKFNRNLGGSVTYTKSIKTLSLGRIKYNNIIVFFKHSLLNFTKNLSNRDLSVINEELLLINKLGFESIRMTYVIKGKQRSFFHKRFNYVLNKLVDKDINNKAKVDFTNLSQIAVLQGFNVEDIFGYRLDDSGNQSFMKLNKLDTFQDEQFELYYVCLTQNDTNSKILIEKIVSDVNQKIADNSQCIRCSEILITGKDKAVFLMDFNQQELVVKVPFSTLAKQAEIRQNRLRMLFREELRTISRYIPESLGEGDVEGYVWYAESKILGDPIIKYLKKSESSNLLWKVQELLQNLCPLDYSCSEVFEEELYHILVRDKLDDIKLAYFDDKQFSQLHKLFHKWFFGQNFKLGFLHGDFSVRNIYVSDGQISGLIDWEDAQEKGLSILDTINYLDSLQRTRNPSSSIVDSVKLLVGNDWPNKNEFKMLKQMFSYHNLDFSKIGSIASLYGITHLSDQIRLSDSTFEDAFIKRCQSLINFISTLSE